ncbi:MAG: hypothetical protein ACF8Q5_04465 [Phycisphaerales bacterium JB040]
MTTTQASTVTNLIDAAKLGFGLAEALAKDIPADRFARQLSVDGKPVNANHPAYCYGHLAIYPIRIIGFLGGDGDSVAAPEHWNDLFKMGAECHDDPDGSIYPAKDELVERVRSGYGAVLEQLAVTDESLFAQPFPDEKMRERFPTIGMTVTFMLTSHFMFHLGQVSTWRRCMGLGPVM